MYAQLMGNVVVSKTRVRPVHNASSLHDKERVCRGPGATSQCSCEAGARRHGQPADMRSKLRELEGQLRDCEERKKAAERRASISEEEVSSILEIFPSRRVERLCSPAYFFCLRQGNSVKR